MPFIILMAHIYVVLVYTRDARGVDTTQNGLFL